jgi:hypothetical protein
MTEQTTFTRDDTVYVLDQMTDGPSGQYPGAWRVEKVNPRSLGLVQEEGGRITRRLKCDKSLATKTEPQAAPGTFDFRTPFSQGTVVRWATAPAQAGTTLFVVIRDDGLAAIQRLVPLGNATGRYWRNVPVRQVERVSLDDILKPGVQQR